MIKCPNCGKELKHKGALNGHLAFAHGVRTPRGLRLDELRSLIIELNDRLTDLETADLTKKPMARLCSYCDELSVRANTKRAERSSLLSKK